jgi:hypothetical protein
MDSEASQFETPRPLGLSLWDVPLLHEDILRHIATFLDFQSIRKFRLVSSQWNAAGTGILLKRGYYDLTYPCHENELPDLYRGAIHYSSWKISHSVYVSAELLHDHQMWQNVRSLTIHQLIPLTREFHRWAWETIQTRCPNLQEITFIFEHIPNSQPETPIPYSRKVYKDYKRAIRGKPNASFPRISNLRDLASVQFKGIYDNMMAYFAQNLLQACTNLRHLYFCPIGQPTKDQLEVEAFNIFKYLKRNPSLLSNLQSFSFKIGFYDGNENDESDPQKILGKQFKFTKFIQRQDYSSLQFNSENLRTLFWDSPFHLDDQLLPGVLTSSVASSLVQLCLNGQVMKLEKMADITLHPVRISFPDFPRLRALKLGFLACRSLSVPELVDSAPNLSVLELKGLAKLWGIRNEMSTIWRASDKESVSNSKQPHLQLRIFCTDIPFRDGLSTLQKISSKFPNLVELRLGRVKYVDPDPFLSTVKSYHSKIQRLTWTLVEEEGEMFTLVDIFHHLLRVPEKIPTLNSYSLRHDEDLFYNEYWEDDLIQEQDVKKSADILLQLISNSNTNNSCLRFILRLRCLKCSCQPTEEEEAGRNECKLCYLHQFIQNHNLPIHIPSEREIKERMEKYRWNHRFASCWIYK